LPVFVVYFNYTRNVQTIKIGAVEMSDLQYTAEEMAEIIRDAIYAEKSTPKTISTPVGYLHFWYANNKGNCYNTTIVRSSALTRAPVSAKQNEVFAVVKVNFWCGIPKISRANALKLA
jgi:hypothetical protein